MLTFFARPGSRAEEGTSVSGLLAGDRLEELVRRHKAYDAARRRALSVCARRYDLQWTPPRSRDRDSMSGRGLSSTPTSSLYAHDVSTG